MSIFTSNLVRKPKTSVFGLSHTNTLTLDMPNLVPVLCRDVIPGDTWKISSEIFLRMMPMLSPIMQDVDVFCHYFYVPLRLVCHEYDNFFNPEEQDNVYRPFIDPAKAGDYAQQLYPSLDDIPIDSTKRTTAQQQFLDFILLFAEGSLADYLGIPVIDIRDAINDNLQIYDAVELQAAVKSLPKFSAIPFLQYQLIYDEFYRDQTLEDSILQLLEPECDGFVKGKFSIDEPFDVISPAGFTLLMSLQRRAWRKDYFTSALPTPQAGPDVHLPLTGNADVVLKGIGEGPVMYDPQLVRFASSGLQSLDTGVVADSHGQLGVTDTTTSEADPVVIDPNGTLEADLSSVTSATINELRRAVRAQEFLEKCARGGRRYIEMILSHFGVRSSDSRLDRPEFLGGGRQPFTISEVLSHVGEDDTQNFILGEMAGHGLSYGQSSYTRRFFEEHGFIFAIVSILPKASYQQGLERMWTRESIYDYAWPSFANLGEQEILNKEIYAASGDPDGVFGYAPRYSEYKYIPSSVHGQMRTSLSYWHLGRIFSSAPALNGDFVHPRVEELKRIFAVQDDSPTANSILGVIKHHITCARRLPKYGIPTL